MLKRYQFGFDIPALLLFLAVMAPNLIWFAVPAPQDILRVASVTPTVDRIGSVCQVAMIGSLLVLLRREREQCLLSPLKAASLACVLLYYVGWALYYTGLTVPLVVLLLTVPPCLSFLLFALDRKNAFALFFGAGFTVCHLVFAIANFII